MAFQYSERAVREAIRNMRGPQAAEYQAVGTEMEEAVNEGKTEARRRLRHTRGIKPPELSWPLNSSISIPTTVEEAASYIRDALSENAQNLRERGLTELEVTGRITPFVEAYNAVFTRMRDALRRRNLPDLPSTPITDDIAYILRLFPANSASELLDIWRNDLGTSYEEMGKRVNPPVSKGNMAAYASRTLPHGFSAYHQILSGLGIPFRSLFSAAFAVRLAADYHEPTTKIATLAEVLKYYRNLRRRPQTIGEFLEFLQMRIGTKQEVAKLASLNPRTISQIANERNHPHPDTLFRILEGHRYYPGSKESILAVMLALESAESLMAQNTPEE